MNKDVIISICGLHTMEEEQENMEMIAPGEYYNRNGKHYVLYEEVTVDDISQVNKNTVKVSDKMVEIIRKGNMANAHMVFEEGKKNISYYQTPFGNLLIGLSANKVQVEEQENEMNISIDYSLEVNYEHLSDCEMTLSIKSKETADITLS